MTGQVTNTVTRKHGGMPNWAVLGVGVDHEGKLKVWWPYTSDIDGERFLTRFIFFRTPLASADITRIHMDDTDRPYAHDHSRTFWSLKFGWYSEWVHSDPENLDRKKHIRHRRFGIHRLRYTQAHTITEVSPRLVTVLFLGPHRQASNYWTPAGKQSIGMGVDQPEEWG